MPRFPFLHANMSKKDSMFQTAGYQSRFDEIPRIFAPGSRMAPPPCLLESEFLRKVVVGRGRGGDVDLLGSNVKTGDPLVVSESEVETLHAFSKMNSIRIDSLRIKKGRWGLEWLAHDASTVGNSENLHPPPRLD